MAFEPSIAVFDSCILYPFHLRNIIVQAAVDRLVEAHWTDEIHDEWMRNLMVQVPAIPLERLQVTRQLMNSALPTATIRGYEEHIPRVTLLVLLRHKFIRAVEARQHGHRGKRLTRASMMRRR